MNYNLKIGLIKLIYLQWPDVICIGFTRGNGCCRCTLIRGCKLLAWLVLLLHSPHLMKHISTQRSLHFIVKSIYKQINNLNKTNNNKMLVTSLHSDLINAVLMMKAAECIIKITLLCWFRFAFIPHLSASCAVIYPNKIKITQYYHYFISALATLEDMMAALSLPTHFLKVQFFFLVWYVV